MEGTDALAKALGNLRKENTNIAKSIWAQVQKHASFSYSLPLGSSKIIVLPHWKVQGL